MNEYKTKSEQLEVSNQDYLERKTEYETNDTVDSSATNGSSEPSNSNGSSSKPKSKVAGLAMKLNINPMGLKGGLPPSLRKKSVILCYLLIWIILKNLTVLKTKLFLVKFFFSKFACIVTEILLIFHKRLFISLPK